MCIRERACVCVCVCEREGENAPTTLVCDSKRMVNVDFPPLKNNENFLLLSFSLFPLKPIKTFGNGGLNGAFECNLFARIPALMVTKNVQMLLLRPPFKILKATF